MTGNIGGGLRATPCERCSVLEDLLETAHRNVDLARTESDKADDEALHWKTVAAREEVQTARRNYATILTWKRRAEEAEAQLAKARGETA